MDLADQLYIALRTGQNMFDVLRKAKIEGVSRIEAEKAAHRLFDLLPPEIPQKPGEGWNEHDYATEVILVTQNACRPEFKIWPDE